MTFIEIMAPLLVLVICGAFSFAARQHFVRSGAGTIGMGLRVMSGPSKRWSAGIGRYSGESLLWYRAFTLSTRPARVLSRRDLHIIHRRPPTKEESWVVEHDAIVLECQVQGEYVHIAISEQALNGFLSWLESLPPGYRIPGVVAN